MGRHGDTEHMRTFPGMYNTQYNDAFDAYAEVSPFATSHGSFLEPSVLM